MNVAPTGPGLPMSEESDDTRHRQLDELLTEIRVVLPGVQVLFAFLLSLPFLNAAQHVTSAQRVAYFISFFSTTLAIALLITPSAYHRMRFHQRQKEQIIASGSRLMLAALGLLATAMVAAVFVVTAQLLGTTSGAAVTVVAGLVFAGLWYVFPLTRRRSRHTEEPEPGQVAGTDPRALPWGWDGAVDSASRDGAVARPAEHDERRGERPAA